MSIGKTILNVRKEKGMSQEEFGGLFHVTRQTISNWENEKNYPDLNTLVTMSDMFEISLDKLLKEDKQMVKTIDKERLYGKYYKHKQSIIDFFTGAGTGLVISCCISQILLEGRLYFALGLRCSLLVELRNLDGTKMLLSIWKSKKRSNKDTSKLEST